MVQPYSVTPAGMLSGQTKKKPKVKNVYEISNFLLPQELEAIERKIKNREVLKEDDSLGRVLYTVPDLYEVNGAIQQRVANLVGKKLDSIGGVFAEYSSKYGQPNLPPHFDGDNNSLIIDYQYKSNTSWGLGVDTTVFEMEDNKAIIFNPNEYPHWRPRKTFKEGEAITMIFFRFPDNSGKVDYSHLRMSQDDDIFADIRKRRDSL
jgi:hypothetical protein